VPEDKIEFMVVNHVESQQRKENWFNNGGQRLLNCCRSKLFFNGSEVALADILIDQQNSYQRFHIRTTNFET
jgi:hypothetical protein